ncbi:deubiquitinase DESI2-like [Onthophagus taurus]|uniref:deubiquitinase DESI2-like n=1 Tax=Onthophagus taurus TaxID=166361 RepID=UPI000C2020B4|nr:desumoylating isopeptidase 2-like [Onthophagus taurus]
MEPVFLNVYDIVFTASSVTSNLGLGVYHSGVAVYNTEYTFFGHEDNTTGVFEMSPNDDTQLGHQFKFRESILLGYTALSRNQIEDVLRKLELDFPGNSYHLTNRNCNHFSNEFSNIICKENIPLWVNRSAYFGSWIYWGIKPFKSIFQSCQSNPPSLTH